MAERRAPHTPSACALCWRLTDSPARVRTLLRSRPRAAGARSRWRRSSRSTSPRVAGRDLPRVRGRRRGHGVHAPCPGLHLKPLYSLQLANRSPPCPEPRPMNCAHGPLPAPLPVRPFPRSPRDGRGAGSGVGLGDAPWAGSQWEAEWALMDGGSNQWRGAGCTSRRGESVIWRRPTITCSSCC